MRKQSAEGLGCRGAHILRSRGVRGLRSWGAVLRVVLVVWSLSLSLLVSGQTYCPGGNKIVCDRCPNQCPDTCEPVTHNHKCSGASWGNTNSTFMDLACDVPPGLPPEQFPLIPILEPEYTSPLVCNGTILNGLWPFDADNMTFTVETTYRDPENLQQNVNIMYLQCVSFELQPTYTGVLDDDSTNQALGCSISQAQKDAFAYTGLSLYVCVGTQTSRDPYCLKGRWIEVAAGACLNEVVHGEIELTDAGSRLLVRVGGPNNMTGCQTKWDLKINRRRGSCISSKRGFGSCCNPVCVNGAPQSSRTCTCVCPAGFVGPQCERTTPHLVVELVVFNKTQSDWVVGSVPEIGQGQTTNQWKFSQVVATIMGVPSAHVEFDSAYDQGNLGTGAGGLDGFYANRSIISNRRAEKHPGRELLQAPHCTSLSDNDVVGVGLSRVRFRVLATFEHELPQQSQRMLDAFSDGRLESALADEGLYLCILDAVTDNYNSFGFPMRSKEFKRPAGGITTDTVLLILFGLLAFGIVLLFVGIQVYSARALDMDKIKHLREYKPIMKIHTRALGWRYIDPVTGGEIGFPSKVSTKLENAYLKLWLGKGEALFKFDWESSNYTADFSLLRLYENSAGAQGVIVRVLDAMTIILDHSAASEDHFYVDRNIKIVGTPAGSEARMLGQERKVVAYAGGGRECKVEPTFLPAVVPGCTYQIGGRRGVAYRQLLPPGLEKEESAAFQIEAPPPQSQNRRYKEWRDKAKTVSEARIKLETHFPRAGQLPPTTILNIDQLMELQHTKEAREEMVRKTKALHHKSLGREDDKGISHFSGGELRRWQAEMHNEYMAIEGEKREIQKADKQRIEKSKEERKLRIDNEQVIVDEAFRSELFGPGSSTKVLSEIGVVSTKASPFFNQRTASSASSGSAGSMANLLKKRRAKNIGDSEVYDEVAV